MMQLNILPPLLSIDFNGLQNHVPQFLFFIHFSKLRYLTIMYKEIHKIGKEKS